ncbi:MAG: hypothetical protein J6D04_05695 [Clostridia bacterium]|nr:hypothetical protein [Clostridia bacterium]
MRAETDLGRVIQLVLKGWKLVVTLTVLFAVCAFLYTEFMVVPTYTSSGKLAVYNRSSEQQDAMGGYAATDFTASVKLVNTCIDIMKQPQFLDRVRAQLSDSDAAALSLGKISMSAVEETEILSIKVTDTNPYRAQRMADAILKVAPTEIKEHIFIGNITSIYSATTAVRRSNQMPVRVLGGGLAGMVLAVLMILLADLFNTTINSGEEISQQYGLPVLGNIPDIVEKKKKVKKEAAEQ